MIEILIIFYQDNKTSGFTRKERNSFGKFLSSGFVDVHRHFYPNELQTYTFWTYKKPTARENNVGWRLDYFVVSNRLVANIKSAFMRTAQLGSEFVFYLYPFFPFLTHPFSHCPIGIIIDPNVAELANI